MKGRTKTLAAAVAAAAVSLSAVGEESDSKENESDPRWSDWSTSVMGMYVEPDDDRFDTDDGTGGRVGFGYPLGDSFSVELSGMGNNLNRDQRSGDDWQYQLGVDGIFWLHDGAVSPYALLGGGASYLDYEGDSDAGPYANAGVGLKVPVWEDRMAIRAEARYTADWADDASGNAEFGDTRFLVGVSIPLFGPPETPEPEVRTETKIIEREKVVEKIPDMQPLDGVTFEFDSDNLTPNAEVVLDRIVRDLDYHDHVTVEIRGHTDSVGSEEYNRKLSRDRAEAVKEYLVDEGIEADRITTRGLGESEPVATNETETGRRKNRRIEMKRTDDDRGEQTVEANE